MVPSGWIKALFILARLVLLFGSERMSFVFVSQEIDIKSGSVDCLRADAARWICLARNKNFYVQHTGGMPGIDVTYFNNANLEESDHD
jgi:hypothetical protein